MDDISGGMVQELTIVTDDQQLQDWISMWKS